MGAKRQVLGFPSLTAAAVALREAGYRPVEIAAMINRNLSDGGPPTTNTYVSKMIDAGRKALSRRAAPRPEPGCCLVVVPTEVLRGLTSDAAARGLSEPQLAREILAAVAADGLVAAVLDDGGGA